MNEKSDEIDQSLGFMQKHYNIPDDDFNLLSQYIIKRYVRALNSVVNWLGEQE